MNSAKLLLDLQAIDQRFAAKRTAYRRITAELKAEGDLKKLRSESDSARIAVLERRLERGKLEAEVSSLRERLESIESRLYSGAITNLRELTALEAEHSTNKRALARAEEALIPARVAAEEAQERYENLKNKLATSEEDWKTTKRALKKHAREVGKECQELQSERQSATATIDERDLALYSSLLPRKSGVAVARVERGICQGCRIKLPMREIARLKNADRLVACSSCGRILLAE